MEYHVPGDPAAADGVDHDVAAPPEARGIADAKAVGIDILLYAMTH